jgi:hypothetical protein
LPQAVRTLTAIDRASVRARRTRGIDCIICVSGPFIQYLNRGVLVLRV